MMSSIYKRPVSPGEKYYLLYDTPNETPLIIHLVVEGVGSFNLSDWQHAVQQAATVNPGCRVKLTGKLGLLTWVETSQIPPIHVVESAGWDGMSSDQLPWEPAFLPAHCGTVFDIILVKGQPNRAVFRVHHAVMDGRALCFFVKDIFSALGGKKIIGSLSKETCITLARKIKSTKPTFYPEKALMPTGLRSGNDQRVVWYRQSVSGKFNNLLPTVLLSVARHARKFSKGSVRFQIPVDMRRHIDEKTATGNLTGGIIVDMGDQPIFEHAVASIQDALMLNRDMNVPAIANVMMWIPFFMARRLLHKGNEKMIRNQNYYLTGNISNLGRMKLSDYSGGGFDAQSVFCIPSAGARYRLN